MRIVFATDHAGVELKDVLVAFVRDELGHETEDFGAYKVDPEDDYPDYISKAARAVSENPEMTRGVIIGGSGQGEAIVANRFPSVRATVYYGGAHEILTLAREHNDANVLSLGARFLTPEEACAAASKWLHTEFSGDERHVRRIKKIDTLVT